MSQKEPRDIAALVAIRDEHVHNATTDTNGPPYPCL